MAKGRGTARPNKKAGQRKGGQQRSGWVKPDGTPLRKRKGEYFPDNEIEKRTPSYKKKREDSQRPPVSAGSSAGTDRPSRVTSGRVATGKPFRERTPRDSKPAFSKRSDRDEKPAYRDQARSGDREASSGSGRDFKPSRDDRSPRSSFSRDRKLSFSRGPKRDEKPAHGKEFRTVDRQPEPASDKDSRPYSGDRGSRPAFSRDRKPAFTKRADRGNRPGYDKFRKDRRDSGPRRERKPHAASSESATGAIRLNKYIANAGICSRREADDLITAGVISINGEIVTELGTKVMPGDEVKFHEQTLRTEKPVYLLLNKPKDFITTTDDPLERKTVMNLVHDACKERILPVGRLDRNTTGLLLFTNDGDLTKKLTHPSGNITKIYTVELDRNITRDDMQRALHGVELEDGPAAFDAIEFDVSGEKNIVGVELHSGRNRIVRRIFEELGYNVKKLDRVMFAGLTKKDLPRGRWRFLTEMEVNSLKMMTGKGRKQVVVRNKEN
jgi:23S rRNA pseudouridine2605 synthase